MGRLETAVFHFSESHARAQDVELSEIEAFFRKGIQKVSRFVQNLRKWSEEKIPLEFPIRLFRRFGNAGDERPRRSRARDGGRISLSPRTVAAFPAALKTTALDCIFSFRVFLPHFLFKQ